MLRKLFLATGNSSKAREIAEALNGLGLEIISIADLPTAPDRSEPPEDGETFEENARIKAEFWQQETGLPTLADDSGILVEALPGELGVRTVRFGAGAEASDAEWLEFFLKRMEESKTRRAKFISVLAFAEIGKPTEFFRGEVEGKILKKAAAPILPRIPLSSVFLADGAMEVFAAMSTAGKSRFSHRGRALKKVEEFLENY
ncbi:non-canonical purine NTP pyrophosphatase [Patescibacteria group bacterium]|nr:non-canonical purine NTP pyrophosphatase [Patescibacteria group bacterium]